MQHEYFAKCPSSWLQVMAAGYGVAATAVAGPILLLTGVSEEKNQRRCGDRSWALLRGPE